MSALISAGLLKEQSMAGKLIGHAHEGVVTRPGNFEPYDAST